MPTFHYTAKKGPAEIVEGDVTANSRDHAVTMIESLGFFPIKVTESVSEGAAENVPLKVPAVSKDWFGPKVSSRDMDTFIWQLANLMRSSIPLLRALSLIAKQTKSKAFKTIAEDLEGRIQKGELLSEAMARYSDIFNNLTLSMIRTGEKSGSLDEVLFKLTEHREKEQDIKHKIQSALAYPVVVVLTGIGTVFLMFTVFLPKLTGLFSRMKQDLPVPTKILMALTDLMARYWFLFVTGFIAFGVIAVRKMRSGKKDPLMDRWVLGVPGVSRFVTTSEMARFCRSLELLLKNGITVHESLPLATNTLNNQALRDRISAASVAIVSKGSTLSESFRSTGIFPEFLLSMIAVGEESGKLEEALAQIASSYEKEVDQTIKVMVSLVEPLLILSVGGIVGFIVFAMLLPILNMSGMGQ